MLAVDSALKNDIDNFITNEMTQLDMISKDL